MCAELITLNNTLCIKNETVNKSTDNSLVNYFVSIAVLAEMAISKSDRCPWLIEKKLDKYIHLKQGMMHKLLTGEIRLV